ncbi:hypothetical protein J4456_02535 [Candidatus Pacearchaeota archaeon]|nr:hypothetical protein [Candidatus Pacearchaeota archaeon]
MSKTRKSFAQKYGIRWRNLEKFSDDEFGQLAAMCGEYNLDPSHFIHNYQRTLHLLNFPLTKELMNCTFKSSSALVFFLENFHFESAMHSPLECLRSSYDYYEQSKQTVKNWVLSDEKKDQRVNPTLESFFNELKLYEPQLEKLRVAVMVTGSFYFGDPSIHPDIDFDFIHVNKDDNPDNILETIVEEIEESFPIRVDGSAVNLENYQKDFISLKHNKYQHLFIADSENLEFFYITNSLVLNPVTYLPFCKNAQLQRKIGQLQKNINKTARTDDILRALLINCCDSIISDRRRGDIIRPVYKTESN